MENILGLLFELIILVFSAILHEIAHGYVADRLGDPTARLSGRLTLNPLKHIDWFMTFLLPLILLVSSGGKFAFGGAKPVPIDPFNLKEGRKDIALVSLAGPGTNILLAVIASLVFHILPQSTSFLFSFLSVLLITIAQINLFLAIFNLLPIPPLDGSKIFALILPEKEAQAYVSIGNVGTIILIFLLVTPIGGFSLENLIIILFTVARHLLGI